MKIAQTFWSCNRDLFNHSFGWLSPQDHIMGWALSCLKLKEHYEDLHLYTDANGISVFVDYLNLPYKTASACHDNINDYCRYLWALPKIMTYAAQEEPFIHVDGDVFIWKKFDKTIERAGLVAQNLETDSGFYKGLMEDVLLSVKVVPDYLNEALAEESILSYNAGIFGGNDLAFIQKYCKAALTLVNSNFDIHAGIEAPLNFNLLFEQILFSALTKLDGKEVSCYYSDVHDSDDYTIGDYADFTAVPHRLKYLHLVGGHKRNPELCDLLRRTLLKEYPEYYFKIIALFKNEHRHFDSKITSIRPQIAAALNRPIGAFEKPVPLPFPKTRQVILKENNYAVVGEHEFESFIRESPSQLLKNVFGFETQLRDIMKQWDKIPAVLLHEAERASVDYIDFLFSSKAEQLSTVFRKNVHLEIIEDSYQWEIETKKAINGQLINKYNDALGLAYLPRLFDEGYTEVVLDEIKYNILELLQSPMSLRDLVAELAVCFEEPQDENEALFDLVVVNLRYLFRTQCIFIHQV